MFQVEEHFPLKVHRTCRRAERIFFPSQKNHLMLSSEKFNPPAPSPSGDGAIFKAIARKKSFHLSIDNYSFKHVFNFQFSIDFNKATDIKLISFF
jgi:hypothetical protein